MGESQVQSEGMRAIHTQLLQCIEVRYLQPRKMEDLVHDKRKKGCRRNPPSKHLYKGTTLGLSLRDGERACWVRVFVM